MLEAKGFRFVRMIHAGTHRLARPDAAPRSRRMRPGHGGSALLTLVTTALILLAGLPCQAGFTPLGDLPGGSFVSAAFDCSADGSAVAGYCFPLGQEAFHWSADTGMIGLGNLPNTYSSGAEGCSGDGLVVVGQSGDQACRWTIGGGKMGLGDIPGGYFWSKAYAASYDGNVVVGYGYGAAGWEAFRWTSTDGIAGLGDLSGGSFESKAYDCSADGTTVVGYGKSAAGTEAFRWTAATGMVGLGNLPGGSFGSKANGCSPDGTYIVGGARSALGWEACLWTPTGQPIALGDLPAGTVYSEAYDCSADGSTVVGIADIGGAYQRAFIWDAANGIRSLQDVLIDQGDDLTGWTLMNAEAISDDGLTIVGVGTNPSGNSEAFVATIVPEPAVMSLLTVGALGLLHRRRG